MIRLVCRIQFVYIPVGSYNVSVGLAVIRIGV